MEKINELIDKIQAKNLTDIAIAVAIVVIFFIMSSWLPKIIMRMFKIKEKSKKKLKENDMYKGLKGLFLCAGFYLAILVLNLSENVFSICLKIIRVIVILSIAKILIGIISPESKLMKKVQENDKFQENKSALNVGFKIVKVIIYVIAGFLIIADFGYDLNGIITGLGLGSVVIGLAAQELVSNLLSGMAISSEKPFKIGDWVTIGTVSGTVVDIKFRSVKVKT